MTRVKDGRVIIRVPRHWRITEFPCFFPDPKWSNFVNFVWFDSLVPNKTRNSHRTGSSPPSFRLQISHWCVRWWNCTGKCARWDHWASANPDRLLTEELWKSTKDWSLKGKGVSTPTNFTVVWQCQVRSVSKKVSKNKYRDTLRRKQWWKYDNSFHDLLPSSKVSCL